MEGLRSVSVDSSGYGPAQYHLDFVDPPGHVIDTLEYAMHNRLPLDIGMGGYPRRLMLIVGMDVRHSAIDITTYGGPAASYPTNHRSMTVTAIEYVPGT